MSVGPPGQYVLTALEEQAKQNNWEYGLREECETA